MVAYHFPPLAGSSGIQRTLRFVQHLPALGWQPLVLTVRAFAYEKTSDDLISEIPRGTVVRRAFALDTARHLQIAGRYIGAMARPDRWKSWIIDGERQGAKLIEQFEPELIWSTYPIASAHVIASRLQRRFGLPWVADFRDPMAQDGYPPDPLTWQRYLEVELSAMTQAQYCVFTTPGAAQMYRDRYPQSANKIVVLENGYDEESFPVRSNVLKAGLEPMMTSGRPMVLLHSGIVYPSERDPTCLFQALGRLAREGRLAPADLIIRFRASVHDDLLQKLAMEHECLPFIQLRPATPYRDALVEMMQVDVLLVLQASNCNAQIPAKIYEYLRAGRPIFALTDPMGDTACVMRQAGLAEVTPLDDADAIAEALVVLLSRWRRGQLPTADPAAVSQASRSHRSHQLAALFDTCTSVGSCGQGAN